MAMVAETGVAATTAISRLRVAVAERVMVGRGVSATTATSRLRAAAAEREMALAFDGGVAATAAGNSCRRAAAAERVVGVPRTPNRDATHTTLRRGLRRRRGVASQLELSSVCGVLGGPSSLAELDAITVITCRTNIVKEIC